MQRTDTLTKEKITAMTARETDSLAQKRDTLYWNEFRPVPLTTEEIKSFDEGPRGVIQKVKKDSVEFAKDSTYVSKKSRNWLWPITGKSFKNSGNTVVFNYKGLLQLSKLQFNTVDGFKYGLSSELSFKMDSGKRNLKFSPYIGYAFSRKQLLWEWATEYKYYTENGKSGTMKINLGSISSDFNSGEGISPFINGIHSLFLKENYMKLYHKKYIEIQSSYTLKRSLYISGNIGYSQTEILDNHSDFAFIKSDNNYTANLPGNLLYSPFGYELWKNFKISINLDIIPYTKPKGDGYNREYDPFPQVTLNYTIGLPHIFGSNSEYQNISVTASKRYWLGRNRIFKYKVRSLYWLSSKNLFFSDYTQIRTNYVPIEIKPFDYSYQLLPYYASNTNKWMIGAHAQYQTKLLVLKRLPLLSTRMWTENLYINYLHNPLTRNYFEFGYTLGQVLAVLETGVFTGFTNFKYSSVGFKVSLDL